MTRFKVFFAEHAFFPVGFNTRHRVFQWQIDEFLSHVRLSPAVEARVRRLNPDGYAEGGIPRGFHRKRDRWRRFEMHVMAVSDFIRRHGRDAYRALPRIAFMRVSGRRRGIRAEYVVDLAR